MYLSRCTITCPLPAPIRIAVTADLHARDYGNALEIIRDAAPDFIFAPGDMMEGTDIYAVTEPFNRRGFDFLKGAAAIAPVYYSIGNHERGIMADNAAALDEIGVHLLDNAYVTLDLFANAHHPVHIGGMSSGWMSDDHFAASASFLSTFAALDGLKLLLCHHPEYYVRLIRATDVDVTVSGHAHGGQWRIFGRGVFAPGQGLFPKYTSGVHENRLCISRGMANTTFAPRFFNPREIVLLELVPDEGENRGW